MYWLSEETPGGWSCGVCIGCLNWMLFDYANNLVYITVNIPITSREAANLSSTWRTVTRVDDVLVLCGQLKGKASCSVLSCSFAWCLFTYAILPDSNQDGTTAWTAGTEHIFIKYIVFSIFHNNFVNISWRCYNWPSIVTPRSSASSTCSMVTTFMHNSIWGLVFRYIYKASLLLITHSDTVTPC